MKLDRYETNLRVRNNRVYSYDTLVANIKDNHIEELGYWSASTRKHINYVGEYFNLKVKNYVK